MDQKSLMDAGEFIRNDLRLRTLPVAAKFLKTEDDFPEKTRRPSAALGKRITVCQAVTMARVYGWTVGLTKTDLICVPAMIAFGLTESSDQKKALGKIFCAASWSKGEDSAQLELSTMSCLDKGEYKALVLSPLTQGLYTPDTVAIYGNPAQVMRAIQALTHMRGHRVQGNLGGKVECTEYLISPFKNQAPRVAIPGMGDRIFSMTQDDEMVIALPAGLLDDLVQGLREAGKKVGARYPITFYQNFQPEFPKYYKQIGDEVGAF